MLCCLDALRWGRADLHTLVPDGDARVRAVIDRWGTALAERHLSATLQYCEKENSRAGRLSPARANPGAVFAFDRTAPMRYA